MKVRIVLLLALILAPALIHAQTHVVIGDSLAFGFQEDKFYILLLAGQYSPTYFNTGFVDWIDMVGRSGFPNFKTANFSCPGETTTTLLNGGCTFHNPIINLPLHQDYPPTTPQINAAFSYMLAHPGQTIVVTITIGANDILNVLSDCNRDATCMAQQLPGATASAAATLANVIIVAKSIAPQAIIVWTNVPDPYMFSDPSTVPYFESFNQAMGNAATQNGARVADWFGEQKKLDPATFCTLSFVCTPPRYDIHPTDLGYFQLAVQWFQAM